MAELSSPLSESISRGAWICILIQAILSPRQLKRLHNLSRGESFHVSEAGPVEGAAAQQAGGDQQGAVVDLVSDNEGEEEEREKNLISGDGSGAAGGIGASAPSLSRFESLRHSPGCTVAYARELTLVGGPFGCMAQFLCPAGVVTNDSVSNFEHNEWSEKCVEEAEKEIARGKQSAINGTGGGDLMEELCGGYYQEACDRVAKLWSDAWKYSKVSGGASEMMTVRPREVEGKIRGVDWVEEVRRGGARPHLVLASSVVAAIIERGLDDGAREGIGLLFGTPAGDAKSGGAGELRVLLCAVIERSEADSRCCSAAGPAIEDVRSRVFREHKLQMLGWYHTHPPNPDSMVALCPSLQDLQEQERFQRMTPDFVGLIASVSRDRNSFQAGVAAFVASRNQATRIRCDACVEGFRV